ncbi:aldose reductase-like [Ceratitis capitata]|uniref:aldose reductase-like n=1 Tax=Ceratitis capitata TaxID=7213 RepID=UPI000A122E8A|nr:aldose reductase-like [Ceratitis capitata]
MRKINTILCKFTNKNWFRYYSGEYRIFHFPGISKAKEENNGAETVMSKIQLPSSKACVVLTEKIDEPSKKSRTPIKNVANTILKEPQECTVKPVTELPENCNPKPPEIPAIKLRDGYMMPMFGLGTWGSAPEKVEAAVKHAIKVGYRMFDCAHVYENEKAVGKAINKSIEECLVKRKNLFITSKLWNTYHHPDLVLEGCRRTLDDLNLSYLNLYLIHWPMGYKAGNELIPYDACGRVLTTRVDYVETWKAMEKLVESGYTRSIGVSNFNKNQIERIWKIAKIRPVVNQIECYPYLPQQRLMAFLKEKGIVLVAYSPLGAPARPWAKSEDPLVLEDNLIKTIAFSHGRTPAQICIRYQIQRGNVVIPKSVTPSRIESNFDVASFELTGQEMKMLDNLDRKLRLVALESVSNHPHYPFHDAF